MGIPTADGEGSMDEQHPNSAQDKSDCARGHPTRSNESATVRTMRLRFKGVEPAGTRPILALEGHCKGGGLGGMVSIPWECS